MRKLFFTHRKELQFDTPIIAHSFSLRLVPRTDSRQIICDLQENVTPVEHMTTVTDQWGTTMYIGDCYSEHSSFSYQVSGIAWVRPTPYVEGPLHPTYSYVSELTHPGPAVFRLYANAHISGSEPGERAKEWMHLVNQTLAYEQGVTDVTTTAEEAAAGGRGVCQDFAHLMIALCRKDGIPARYIVGYMLGEGETHAWVEIYDGARWLGLDPTHDRPIDDGYICLTVGRDYNDCILDRGFFRTPRYNPCTVTQSQTVNVKVYDSQTYEEHLGGGTDQ